MHGLRKMFDESELMHQLWTKLPQTRSLISSFTTRQRSNEQRRVQLSFVKVQDNTME